MGRTPPRRAYAQGGESSCRSRPSFDGPFSRSFFCSRAAPPQPIISSVRPVRRMAVGQKRATANPPRAARQAKTVARLSTGVGGPPIAASVRGTILVVRAAAPTSVAGVSVFQPRAKIWKPSAARSPMVARACSNVASARRGKRVAPTAPIGVAKGIVSPSIVRRREKTVGSCRTGAGETSPVETAAAPPCAGGAASPTSARFRAQPVARLATAATTPERARGEIPRTFCSTSRRTR